MLLRPRQPVRRGPPRHVLRALRGLSTVLIAAGTMLIIDAGLTLVWQEPVSAVYAKYKQKQLGDDLHDLQLTNLTRIQTRALARLGSEQRRVAFLARALRRDASKGQAIGRIRIPRIGASFVVVQGTDTASLRKGPGHYPETPLPGAHGTTAFAGHRTTYLAPFRKIDKLRRGDRVIFEMPYARLTYKVELHRIVDPHEVAVIRRRPYDRLVLTACHPLYSAAKRYVIFARLAETEPRGAARMSAWPGLKHDARAAAA